MWRHRGHRLHRQSISSQGVYFLEVVVEHIFRSSLEVHTGEKKLLEKLSLFSVK